MPEPRHGPAGKRVHWSATYLCTPLAVSAALFLHLRLEEMTSGELPHFVLFYPVVMIVALVAGLGPGLLATATTALLASLYILPPDGLGIASAADITSLCLFCGMGIFMSVVADRYLRLRKNLVIMVQKQTADLQDAIEELATANEELQSQQEELCAANDEAMRAETELLRAKLDWERTFDSVPDLIAIMDTNHRIMRVNRAMAERLGTAPEECIGKDCFRCVHGTDRPPLFCPHALTVADGSRHQAEVSEECLGGDFLVTTTPLMDELGRMIGSVHVARNITESKQSEEQIKRQLAELRRNNEELTRFNSASVGRELRMIELKTEINELCKKAGETPRYPLRFEEGHA